MFRETLEKIVFNEEKLDALKKMITSLDKKLISTREFRKEIFGLLNEIFEEIVDFFPFYVSQQQKSKEIDVFISEPSEYEISGQLEERDALLSEIFDRLKGIRDNILRA